MSIILLSLLIFLDILKWLIIASVIISWVWIQVKFIDSILEPCYEFVEKYIPTKIWPISFTPVVLIFALAIIETLIFSFDPTIKQQYFQLINF